MPNLNTTILCSVPITYPPLSTQRMVASVLSDYDDLIENNTRRIDILEEQSVTHIEMSYWTRLDSSSLAASSIAGA